METKAIKIPLPISLPPSDEENLFANENKDLHLRSANVVSLRKKRREKELEAESRALESYISQFTY